MFSSSPLDWGLIVLYFGFLAAVWLRGRRQRADAVDYLVAGRRVTLPALIATLVATWYGGILGVGEYSYRYGLANWLVFGVPYYIGALLFALLFARRAREQELYTIPDLLARAGRGPALFGAFVVFLTAAPAAYVLMLGTLFAAMFGLPLVPCILAAAVVSLFYIDKGGLRTVVFTDQVQFALMYAGFAILLGFLVARHGGLGFLQRSLPASHFTWHGGNPPQAILVWYFIALSALVDPGFWQRAYAARDPVVAKRAVLGSIVCWAVFDFMTTFSGLYARAVLPRLADPVFAFPEIARATLPPFALGLFYLAMIATVMSTIDSYGFIAATTIGRDLVWRLGRGSDEALIPFYSRIGLWVACAFSAVLALARESVIGLWHDVGSITTPAMLVPVGVALTGRGMLGPSWTLATMVAPFVVSLTWVLHRALVPNGGGPWAIEPIYPGLATSVAVYLLGRAFASRGSATLPATGKVAGAACAVAIAFLATSRAVAQPAAPDTVAADTLSSVVALPEVVVSTARAGDRTPVAVTKLTRDQLTASNLGQDTPMLLARTPGAFAYSDAGNGIGYSYLSIRGFPQRRISVLINGVPLNDPESHEVYWIDHPDLLASTAEVQIQRGVGSALYGAASVGGSVNLETAPFSTEPGAAASVSYGTYDTKRLMLEMNSGDLAGGWNLYGRYSRIATQGYREQSWSRLWSYAISARHLSGKQSVRLNLYGGPEETHLAYLGVPQEYLSGTVTGDRDQDRRFNPLTYPNERDHFFEPHYELIHSWTPDPGFTLSQTLFYFDGKGYYDEQRFGQLLSDYRLTPWYTADTLAHPPEYFATDSTGTPIYDAQGRKLLERFDLVRRRTVANRHYGWVPRARIEHAGGTLTVGGELRAHDGRHYGAVITGDGAPPGTGPDQTYYDYHPRTLAAGLFAREEWRARPRWLVTADLAWRHQEYDMRDDAFDGIHFVQRYDFAIPRLGVTWTPRTGVDVFASYAYSSREPALRDLYDGEGAGNVPLFRHQDPVTGAWSDPLITPEHVNDWELGGAWSRGRQRLAVNLFHMDFHDELVYAGQFDTDLGYPILGNAARSVHQGVEISGHGERALGAQVMGLLDLSASFADNHFVSYHEVYGTTSADVVSYDGKAIGFFPATIADLAGALGWKGASLGADVRYTGRIYVDNTETQALSIAPRTVLDLTAGYRRPVGNSTADLSVHVFNVADTRYETSGYLDYDAAGNLVPQYVPAATRNVLVQMRVAF